MRLLICFSLTLLALPVPSTAANILVRMEGADYGPSRIEARVGDRLVFMNDDTMDHDVFVPTAGHGLDLGKQAPGETTAVTLGKAGRFEVECVFHPDMLLTVDVKP